ncbi:MAG TPA: hypothetical protein VHM48_11245 [Candidatus Limnocylindrales bacterium]|nr:hypothetical protein [Candidatus Limnocylindrales bacterium]
MLRLEGRKRIEQAVDWTARHHHVGPFAVGLAATLAVLLPIPVGGSVFTLAADNPVVGPLTGILGVVLSCTVYPMYAGTAVAGYVVGRSSTDRRAWRLAVGGSLIPIAIPLLLLWYEALRNYGGSSLVLPVMIPLLYIPFQLGHRRGLQTAQRLPAPAVELVSVPEPTN